MDLDRDGTEGITLGRVNDDRNPIPSRYDRLIALDDFLLGGNPRTYGYRHTVRNERQSADGSAVR